jgi:hypothetical protein
VKLKNGDEKNQPRINTDKSMRPKMTLIFADEFRENKSAFIGEICGKQNLCPSMA